MDGDSFRSLGLLFTLLACIASTTASENKLIGWLGESYNPGDSADKPRAAPRRGSEALSWDPRIFQYHGFLSEAEVQHIIDTARPRIERSGVVDTETGAEQVSDIRTSSGMFFERGEDDVIRRIERRIAEWTMVPEENGEGIQVLKYEKTQKYDSHFDYFFHKDGINNGGNRLLTILMYLSAPEAGGETVFPNVPVPRGQTSEAGFSECGMRGLAVKPVRGDAIAFWSLRPDGRLSPGSLHGGCPVLAGEKWSATKWVHVGRYAVGYQKPQKIEHVIHVPPPPPAPPNCHDTDAHCAGWADSGECEANPGFMVGTAARPGACLLSCNRCDLAP